MSKRSSAALRLPSETWRSSHMIRAWRTHDFRTIFHLASKVGIVPEAIAERTGLSVEAVLNIMKGNATLGGDSEESVASGLGMPEDLRGVLGFPPAKPRSLAPAPLTGQVKANQNSKQPQPSSVKLRDAVGAHIAELRHENGLTQQELAERAEISLETVRKLEQYARTPSLAMLDSVASALGVTAGELIEPASPKGKPGRRRERLPDYLPESVLSQSDFLAACERRDLGAIFEIAGKVDFTVSHLSRRCEMTISQVTDYMRKGREAQSLEIFERVSDGLHIPGHLLGMSERAWESDSRAVPENTNVMNSRNCARCGARLSRYNKDDYCSPCASGSELGAWLRAQRETRGWPRPEMARRLIRAGKDVGDESLPNLDSMCHNVYRWERGADAPSERYRLYYGRAFGIPPSEFGKPQRQEGIEERQLAEAPHSVAGFVVNRALVDDEERVIHAARKATRADSNLAASLAKILAVQREAEDTIGSEPLIQPVIAQLAMIENFVIDARGSSRSEICNVAAQWAEFAGWLHTSTDRSREAREWLDRASEWAIEAGNETLSATTLSFKGHLAFLLGQVGPMLGLSQAAQRDSSIWIGQLAFDAHQEALAWALMGDADAAVRKADEGHGLALLTDERGDARPAWSYYYTLPLYAAERGLVYRVLGRDNSRYNDQAIALLSTALDDMGEARSAEWAAEYTYHLAVAYMQAGSPEKACEAAFEIYRIVHSKESVRLIAHLRKICATLTERWPKDPRVVDLTTKVRQLEETRSRT